MKWGPWPKVVVGVTLGYFAGKLSYQKKCAEKLMTLPNSQLAEALRQRKGKKSGFQEGYYKVFSCLIYLSQDSIQANF